MLPELIAARRLDAGSKSLAAPPASWLAPEKGHRHPGSEWAANDKKRERERESVEGGETIRLFPPHSASTLAVKIVMVMKRGDLVLLDGRFHGQWRKMQQLRTRG